MQSRHGPCFPPIWQIVQLSHHCVGFHGRGDLPGLEHEHAGKVTALDGGYGQVDHGLEREFDPPGPEKALSRLGEVDDQIRGGPAGRAGASSLAAIATQIYSVRAPVYIGANLRPRGLPGYVASCDGKGHHVVREAS